VAKLSEFYFKIVYVPGKQNILANTPSRMYSANALGTVRSPTEYMEHDNTTQTVTLGAVSQVILSEFQAKATMIKDSPPPAVTRPVLCEKNPVTYFAPTRKAPTKAKPL
jgi:hypothetical protein